jgi:hypothetical protein
VGDLDIERERVADWRAKDAEFRMDLEQAVCRAEAAEQELRELRAASAWVPVSTLPPRDPSFPSHSVYVLVWDGRNKEAILGLLQFANDEGAKHHWMTDTGWTILDATHWMPLPQGPEASRG